MKPNLDQGYEPLMYCFLWERVFRNTIALSNVCDPEEHYASVVVVISEDAPLIFRACFDDGWYLWFWPEIDDYYDYEKIVSYLEECAKKEARGWNGTNKFCFAFVDDANDQTVAQYIDEYPDRYPVLSKIAYLNFNLY